MVVGLAVSAWPGDAVRTRDLPVGTLNCKLPEAHPTCTVCGCDCTDIRAEFYGFVTVDAAHGSFPVEYVLITTCMDHWHAPLAARLRAVA